MEETPAEPSIKELCRNMLKLLLFLTAGVPGLLRVPAAHFYIKMPVCFSGLFCYNGFVLLGKGWEIILSVIANLSNVKNEQGTSLNIKQWFTL